MSTAMKENLSYAMDELFGKHPGVIGDNYTIDTVKAHFWVRNEQTGVNERIHGDLFNFTVRGHSLHGVNFFLTENNRMFFHNEIATREIKTPQALVLTLKEELDAHTRVKFYNFQSSIFNDAVSKEDQAMVDKIRVDSAVERFHIAAGDIRPADIAVKGMTLDKAVEEYKIKSGFRTRTALSSTTDTSEADKAALDDAVRKYKVRAGIIKEEPVADKRGGETHPELEIPAIPYSQLSPEETKATLDSAVFNYKAKAGKLLEPGKRLIIDKPASFSTTTRSLRP